MITFDLPPKLLLPEHYQAKRPAIIRPGADIAKHFPFDQAAIPFGAFKGGGPLGATRTYRSSDTEAGAGTTKTRSLNGSARTGKWLVAMTGTTTSGTQTDPSSITLNGTALTKLVSSIETGGGISEWCGIYISTSDIACTGTDSVVSSWALSQNSNSAALYSVDGLNNLTAFATATSSGTAFTVSANTQAGGLVFGVCVSYGTNADITWSGITEDAEVASSTGARRGSYASLETAAASTPLAITGTAPNVRSASCSVTLR